MFPSGETSSTLVLGDPRTSEKGRDQQLPSAPEEQETRARRVIRANVRPSDTEADQESTKLRETVVDTEVCSNEVLTRP